MREILFRGKSTDNGKWIEGHYASQRKIITDKEDHYILTNGGYSGFGFSLNKIDPGTVGQYTGLTDKNGVKIFEGDILHFFNSYRRVNNEWHCVVKYKNAGFVCVYVEPEGHFGEYNSFGGWNYPAVQWDVIGNIHDNPELIGGNGK